MGYLKDRCINNATVVKLRLFTNVKSLRIIVAGQVVEMHMQVTGINSFEQETQGCFLLAYKLQ